MIRNNHLSSRVHSYALFFAIVIGAVCGSACSTHAQVTEPAPPATNASADEQQNAKATASTERETNTSPELWVFGAPGSPNRVSALNGRGVRAIVDLRTLNKSRVLELLRTYRDLDLGLCLTIRWTADENATATRGRGGRRLDTPPTEEEAAQAIEDLVEINHGPQERIESDCSEGSADLSTYEYVLC